MTGWYVPGPAARWEGKCEVLRNPRGIYTYRHHDHRTPGDPSPWHHFAHAEALANLIASKTWIFIGTNGDLPEEGL